MLQEIELTHQVEQQESVEEAPRFPSSAIPTPVSPLPPAVSAIRWALAGGAEPRTPPSNTAHGPAKGNRFF